MPEVVLLIIACYAVLYIYFSVRCGHPSRCVGWGEYISLQSLQVSSPLVGATQESFTGLQLGSWLWRCTFYSSYFLVFIIIIYWI